MAAQKHDDSLEKIAADVRGCPLCKLAKTRKNAVPGEGQLSAKIMFIGEAPGRSEDEEGRPFVGAAGRILNDLLKEDELNACRPYLDRQIALIKPKVICILGRTAYFSLLGGSSITANRGKIVKKAGQKYFLTFHPAAVIYNKSLLSTLEADLKKLAAEINKEEESEASLEDYL